MTVSEKQRLMTTAPVAKLVCKMAVPTIISMLVTALYNMADTYFVGRIESSSATAAVGVAFPLMSIIQAVGFFFGHGSGNAVSRELGAGDEQRAKRLASCGFFSAFAAGLVIMVLGLIFLRPLAVLLGSTDTILPYATDYIGIILIGAPFMMASLVLNNQMRFQGSAAYSMVGITVGAVLNVVLDPLLIFGCQMGIAGAALATIIGQIVSFFVLIVGIRVAGCVRIRISRMKYWPQLIGEIFRGGVPSLCRQGLASISGTVLNRAAGIAAGSAADAAIAAMSIVTRIMHFANSAVIGFGQGFQPVCGFNFGAGLRERVRRAFWFSFKVATVCLSLTAVVGFIFAPSIVGYFRPGDSQVIEIGTVALRFQCVSLPLGGWIIMNNMMFQTCGLALPASMLAAARQGVCFIPAVLLLGWTLGLTGIEMAQAVADVGAFIMALILYFKMRSRIWPTGAKSTQG